MRDRYARTHTVNVTSLSLSSYAILINLLNVMIMDEGIFMKIALNYCIQATAS